MPDGEGLETIVDRLADKLAERDPAFDKDGCFFVNFVVIPNDVRARWSDGELTLLVAPPN